jgi:hypothetical protein
MDPKSIQRFSTWGTGIAVGILLGVAVGVALNSIVIGVIFGLMLGAALEIALGRRAADPTPPHSGSSSRAEQPEGAPAPAYMRNEERPL